MQQTSILPISERTLIFMIGLMQFVNILDFMMVMPLGPDFATALNIPANEIGLIGGAYTFSAALAGVLAALYMDQYARKKAVMICLAGLSVATLAGAFAWDKESMVAARLLAGLFGGPLSALSQALVADYIPPERRGRAMGKVAGAFAAASVIGVPFGLELASRISWHAPFVVTAILGVVVLTLVSIKLPYHKPFFEAQTLRVRIGHFLRMLSSGNVLISYTFYFLIMMSAFMIIPNISAHVQLNLGYPREQLGVLYFFGGLLSFFGMRASGIITDKTSSTMVACLFTASFVATVSLGFVWFENQIPVVVIFVVFMVSMSGRMVAVQALSSKIPAPHERGAFTSIQSAVMHMGSAIGAYYSSRVLIEEHGKLLHMDDIGMHAIALSLLVPVLIGVVEYRLRKQHAVH